MFPLRGGTASAQNISRLFDLSCTAKIANPSPAGTLVQTSGSFGCGRVQDAIMVEVCIYYNGVSLECPTDIREESTFAEAFASFPCLPGVWAAGAMGQATNGKSDVAFSDPVLITLDDCDPLRP